MQYPSGPRRHSFRLSDGVGSIGPGGIMSRFGRNIIIREHNYSGLFEEQGRARGLVGRHPANALSSLGNKTTAADEPTAKGGRRKRKKVESVSYACIQVDWVRSTRQLPGRGFLRRDVGAFTFLLGGKGISGRFFSFCRDQRSACKRAGGLFILSRWCVPGFCFFPFHHITLQLLGFLFTLGLDYGSLDTPIGLGREEEYLSNNGKGENIKVGSSLPDDQTLAFFLVSDSPSNGGARISYYPSSSTFFSYLQLGTYI